MSEETNKALLRRFVEELVNQGNMAVAPELVAPDFIELDPSKLSSWLVQHS